MNRVLIFGVNGFVGPYLVNEFLNNGYKVIGSDIKELPSLSTSMHFIKGDLLDFDSVSKIIENTNPDMIINLAAISSVGISWNIPQRTMMVNIIGALNIMEAARKQIKMPKVMFVGSSEEYEVSAKPIDEKVNLNANNPYGISKVTLEKLVRLYKKQYGMKIYYVRPFNHTGVGQEVSFVLPSFCRQVAEIEKSGKTGTIKVGNLAVKRDFSHVKDIVRAYRMIIENDNSDNIYNVGSGKAYGLDELLNYIISFSKQNIRVEIDQTRVRPTDTPIICCDRSLIRKELGWEPEFSIFDALKEMYEEYLK